MTRTLAVSLTCFFVAAGSLRSQEGPERGTLKSVDPVKGTVTITTGGKDREFRFVEATRLVGADNRDLAKRLEDPGLVAGTPVVFRTRIRGGEHVLVGMKLGGGNAGGGPGGEPPPKVDTSRL